MGGHGLLAEHGGSELCYVARLTERAKRLCAAHGVALTEIKLRVLRVRLPNGQYEYLATSLLNAERYPQHLFADLYARRWAMEEAFKFLKRRVLVACLIETLFFMAERFSPWGYPTGRSVRVASPLALA